MVTLLGESQADHIRTKPNGDKKETSPTILTFQSCLKDKKGAQSENLGDLIQGNHILKKKDSFRCGFELKLNSSCKCDTSLFYKFNFFLSCLIFLKVCASFGDKNPSLFLGL